LHGAIIDVLQDSLAQGGTSFNDYVDHIGQPGQFVAKLAVFQREGQRCPRCEGLVRRIVQSGRSTFYCPTSQR
jgi:formamidopyrimidine-DNA glycosylase